MGIPCNPEFTLGSSNSHIEEPYFLCLLKVFFNFFQSESDLVDDTNLIHRSKPFSISPSNDVHSFRPRTNVDLSVHFIVAICVPATIRFYFRSHPDVIRMHPDVFRV